MALGLVSTASTEANRRRSPTMRVLLEFLRTSVHAPAATSIPQEDPRQPINNFPRGSRSLDVSGSILNVPSIDWGRFRRPLRITD